MPTTDHRYGDMLSAANFLAQVGFTADRQVIETHHQGGTTILPRVIIRVGHHYEPAEPHDLEILAELEEDFGPARRNVSDAILDVPAGRLMVMGAYLPQVEPTRPDPDDGGGVEVPVPVTDTLNPTFKTIIRGWLGE